MVCLNYQCETPIFCLAMCFYRTICILFATWFETVHREADGWDWHVPFFQLAGYFYHFPHGSVHFEIVMSAVHKNRNYKNWQMKHSKLFGAITINSGNLQVMIVISLKNKNEYIILIFSEKSNYLHTTKICCYTAKCSNILTNLIKNTGMLVQG